MPACTRDALRCLTGCATGLTGTWHGACSWPIGTVTACDGWIEHGSLPIPARLLRPDTPNGAAILYAHAHGNRYDIGKAELTEGRPALLDPPLGLHLAQRGYTVLCPDMPGFGARQDEGSESALSKAALWHGRPLLGLMLDDLARAQAALAGLDGVDSSRIGVLGISMGATLAYWHAAIDPSVAACIHLCAFARMAPLIATGAHDLHGPYMTVPGLLPGHDMDDVAALVAPRPQIVCAGLKDPLTPPEALEPALSALRQAYAQQPAALTTIVDPESGHRESPAMRAAMSAFLTQVLG